MSTTTMSDATTPAQPSWSELKTHIEERVPTYYGKEKVIYHRRRGQKEWWLPFRDMDRCWVRHELYLGTDPEVVNRVRRLLNARTSEFRAGFEAELEALMVAYAERRAHRE
jgi:hypothetical protein